MKKLISSALALTLSLGLSVPAFADNADILWLKGEGDVETYEPVSDVIRVSDEVYLDASTGKRILSAYDVYYVMDQFAVITKDGKQGIVDQTGKLLVPPEYDNIRTFSEGLACAEKDGKYGFVNQSGKVVIPFEYDFANSFTEGKAEVHKNGKVGLIDQTGTIVIPLEYDAIYGVHNGIAIVEKNEKKGLVNTSGQQILPCAYADLSWLSDSLILTTKDYSHYGLIDRSGKVILPLEYDDIQVNQCESDLGEVSLIAVSKNGQDGYVDPAGNIVIPLQYDFAYPFDDGTAVVVKDEKYGLIDASGKVILPLEYARLYNTDGLVCAWQDGKHALFDDSGKMLLPFEDQMIDLMSNGFATVRKDEKYGLLDKQGKLILPIEYDGIHSFGYVENHKDADNYRYEISPDKLFVVSKEDTNGLFRVRKDSSTHPVPPQTAFTDVAPNAYYADSVNWAVEKKITSGTSATTFSPNRTCTTAQILTFLWRANGSPEPISSTNPFTDIKESDYFYKAALWAKENDIIAKSDTAFRGSTPCTRSMAVLYIWNAAGSPGAKTPSNFADVSADALYAPAVNWAVEQGITSGTSATTFSPDTTCTRAQIATFLYRAFAN